MNLSKNKEESAKKQSRKGIPKNPPWTQEEDQLLIDNVNLTISELEKLIGRSDGAIRGRKYILGIKSNKFPPFKDDEKDIIKEWYSKENEGVDLEGLAELLGRPKTSISKIARDMGLTKYGNLTREKRDIRSKSMVDKKLYMSSPRFSGHSHSEESKKSISKGVKIAAKHIPKEVRRERARKSIETKRKKGIVSNARNAYSRCKGGFRKDLGQYFRSSWEANIARLLNDRNIEWKYECKRFDFDKEKSGILSYQPDFYLPKYDRWVEVKGWMDEKSIKRLGLFKEYYPKESQSLILVDSKYYYWLDKRFRDVIDNWEFPNNYNKRVS